MVQVAPLSLSLASGRASRTTVTERDKKVLTKVGRAKYKIELFMGTKRTGRGLTPVILTIWESGRRFHGGGDDKMYWCGYSACGKPLTSSNFGYAHVVCPTCHKESFLDPQAKKDHIASLVRDNRPVNDLDKLPIISGEKYCNLTTDHIADLLVATFNDLERDADFYFKHQTVDMRYDKLHETTKDMDKLDLARIKREPAIYSLDRLLVDLANRSDLKKKLLTFLTA
jgi:hypothetical protein